MSNERLTTLETIKSLQQHERRIHWSHVFQNLALVTVLLIGGGWFLCNGGSTCWASNSNAAGYRNATVAAEPEATPEETSQQRAAQQQAVQQRASQEATPQSETTQAEATEDSKPGQVTWFKDHDKALARAKQLDRPVLIDFAASWCVPCVMMDKHVWPDQAVQEALNSKVIPLRIDMDGKSAPKLVEKYQIEFVPTILLIDANAQELQREGFVDAEQLLDMISTPQQTSTPGE